MIILAAVGTLAVPGAANAQLPPEDRACGLCARAAVANSTFASPRAIPEGNILRLHQLGSEDSVWDGFLLGAAIGGVAGIGVYGSFESLGGSTTTFGERLSGFLLGAAFGGTIGALIDAAM